MKLGFFLLFYYCFYSALGCRGISKVRIDSICLYLHNPRENNREDRLRVSIESRGAGWRVTAQGGWWRCVRGHNPGHRLQRSPLTLQQPRPQGRSCGLGLQGVAEPLSKVRAGDCGLTFGRQALVDTQTKQMKELPGGRAEGYAWARSRQEHWWWRLEDGSFHSFTSGHLENLQRHLGKGKQGRCAQRLLVKPCLTGDGSSATKRKTQVRVLRDALHEVAHY